MTHFNGPIPFGLPINRPEVGQANDVELYRLMSLCSAEPADFDNCCLPCYAYKVMQEREEERKTLPQNVTPEQKMRAIRALVPMPSLMMRDNYTWYVSATGVSLLKPDGQMIGGHQAAKSPYDAINDWWDEFVTNLPEGGCISVSSGKNEGLWRWNGFMWDKITMWAARPGKPSTPQAGTRLAFHGEA